MATDAVNAMLGFMPSMRWRGGGVRIELDDRGRLRLGRLDQVQLTLKPDGLLLASDRDGSRQLEWDEWCNLPAVSDAAPERDGWQIDGATSTRYGVRGVGLIVSGALRLRCDPHVRRWPAGTDWFRRFDAEFHGPVGTRLPFTPWLDLRPMTAVRQSLSLLVELLAGDDVLRERLSDPRRMRLLADDLLNRSVPVRIEPSGRTRNQIDIATAMRRSGYSFEHGRPLAALSVSGRGRIVETVCRSLAANPYRTGRTVDRGLVERLVDDWYLNVEPWPFRAIVGDDLTADAATASDSATTAG